MIVFIPVYIFVRIARFVWFPHLMRFIAGCDACCMFARHCLFSDEDQADPLSVICIRALPTRPNLPFCLATAVWMPSWVYATDNRSGEGPYGSQMVTVSPYNVELTCYYSTNVTVFVMRRCINRLCCAVTHRARPYRPDGGLSTGLIG